MSKAKGVSHLVTASDVTLGTITLNFGAENLLGALPPNAIIVQLRSVAGTPILWDGAAILGPHSVTLDNTGAVNFAAGNIFNVVVA